MFTPSKEPLAYLQGRFLPASQARLALNDAGFVQGATITDLCRTFRHKLYGWEDHLARFRRSCRATGIYPPLSEQEITRLAEELVAHNAALIGPEQDLGLVILATPGLVGYYALTEEPTSEEEAGTTFGMHTFPLRFRQYRRFLEQGAALVVPRTHQVPAGCVDPRVKQRSRLHWWLAQKEAEQLEPGALALLLDSDGFITETASANFLLVKNGVVLSPPGQGILEGVSLRVVRELCKELGLGFEEKPLRLYDCQAADEAFLSCTTYCLAGVCRINGMPLPWPGPIMQRLLQAWSKRVGVDIRGQIMGQ